VAPPGNQAATEKTNINLYHSENPVYSPKVGPVRIVYCRVHRGKSIVRFVMRKSRDKRKPGQIGEIFFLKKMGATSNFNFDRKFKAANIDPEINNCLEILIE